MAILPFQASGTISPSRFVKMSGSQTVAQCSAASDVIIGVSQQYAKLAPIPGAALTATDTAGDPVQVFAVGEVTLLESGTAGWTAGNQLTADSSGKGLAASSTNIIGAIALETVSGSGLGKVLVISPCAK